MEYEPGDPRRCLAHLLTDALDIGVFFCFQDDLVVDKMILHPYKNCTFDLMDRLHCERTTVYKLRARAVKKLYRLYFGVGE